MNKILLTKFSILSLVLLTVSLVTAALLPMKSNDAKRDGSANNGTLISASGITPGGGGIKSCISDAAGDLMFSCHVTVPTDSGIASEGLGHKTIGNTSTSDTDNGFDTTSIRG